MDIDAQFRNTTTTSTQSSNASIYSTRNETLAQVEIAVQVMIFLLAVFGNATVLLILLIRRRRLTRMHLLMIHLSSADLFVAFFSVLPQLIWDITYVFHGGDFLCRAVKYFQIVAIYASAYILVMTAIDRYIAICFPFLSHKMSSNRVHLMVTVAWSLSLIFSTPQLFIFSYKLREDGVKDCWATFDPPWTLQLYITCFTLSVYVAPTFILAFCYGRICYTVWSRSRVGERLNPSNNSQYSLNDGSRISQHGSIQHGNVQHGSVQKNISRHHQAQEHGISVAKMKTIRLTLAVVLCYLFCWSPFFIFQMWAAYDPNAPFTSAVFAIILLLASLNSCTNPWIYLFFSESVNYTMKKCCQRKKDTPKRYTFSSMSLSQRLHSSSAKSNKNTSTRK